MAGLYGRWAGIKQPVRSYRCCCQLKAWSNDLRGQRPSSARYFTVNEHRRNRGVPIGFMQCTTSGDAARQPHHSFPVSCVPISFRKCFYVSLPAGEERKFRPPEQKGETGGESGRALLPPKSDSTSAGVICYATTIRIVCCLRVPQTICPMQLALADTWYTGTQQYAPAISGQRPTTGSGRNA